MWPGVPANHDEEVGSEPHTTPTEDTMSSIHQPQQRGVDVASTTPARVSIISLVLGVVSVPGSILTWGSGLPGEGFVWGLPLAVLAVVVGLVAVRGGAPSRWAAVTGIVLGAAMTLMMLVWTTAGLG